MNWQDLLNTAISEGTQKAHSFILWASEGVSPEKILLLAVGGLAAGLTFKGALALSQRAGTLTNAAVGGALGYLLLGPAHNLGMVVLAVAGVLGLLAILNRRRG